MRQWTKCRSLEILSTLQHHQNSLDFTWVVKATMRPLYPREWSSTLDMYWNLLPLCSHLDKTIFLLAGIQVAFMQHPLSWCNASQKLLISNWATAYEMSCRGIKCRFVSYLTSKRQDDWFIMLTILWFVTIKPLSHTLHFKILHTLNRCSSENHSMWRLIAMDALYLEMSVMSRTATLSVAAWMCIPQN
jgi:hypothetical protein